MNSTPLWISPNYTDNWTKSCQFLNLVSAQIHKMPPLFFVWYRDRYMRHFDETKPQEFKHLDRGINVIDFERFSSILQKLTSFGKMKYTVSKQ